MMMRDAAAGITAEETAVRITTTITAITAALAIRKNSADDYSSSSISSSSSSSNNNNMSREATSCHLDQLTSLLPAGS